MKLLTFRSRGRTELGALDDNGAVIPLTCLSGDEAVSSMQRLIEGGEAALDKARRLAAHIDERLAPESVEWLAPLPVPEQMRDFLVFEEHMRMAGWRGAKLREQWGAPAAIPAIWRQQPIYYKCNRFAVAGHGAVTHWPPQSTIIDYELELACIIGKGGRDISASEAQDHIFGYTIFNDLTARDLQFREMQGPLGPAKGKDFDGADILGPVIVTVIEPQDAGACQRRTLERGLFRRHALVVCADHRICEPVRDPTPRRNPRFRHCRRRLRPGAWQVS